MSLRGTRPERHTENRGMAGFFGGGWAHPFATARSPSPRQDQPVPRRDWPEAERLPRPGVRGGSAPLGRHGHGRGRTGTHVLGPRCDDPDIPTDGVEPGAPKSGLRIRERLRHCEGRRHGSRCERNNPLRSRPRRGQQRRGRGAFRPEPRRRASPLDGGRHFLPHRVLRWAPRTARSSSRRAPSSCAGAATAWSPFRIEACRRGSLGRASSSSSPASRFVLSWSYGRLAAEAPGGLRRPQWPLRRSSAHSQRGQAPPPRTCSGTGSMERPGLLPSSSPSRPPGPAQHPLQHRGPDDQERRRLLPPSFTRAWTRASRRRGSSSSPEGPGGPSRLRPRRRGSPGGDRAGPARVFPRGKSH